MYPLKELVMYISQRTCYVYIQRTCYVYKHNELVMYTIKWTRNVYNKILFIEYM